MENNTSKDVYVQRLEQLKEQLVACQKGRKTYSCSQCDQFFTCELRQNYVKAVYESMSKGDTGGFEF
jgi:hypothetical protein